MLLAIAKVETDWGRARQAQPDELVPADIRVSIDAAALQQGGATAQLLGLPDGRRIGDWVAPQQVGTEHAMGFTQFLPSTWRTEAAAAAGGPRDPCRPLDAMIVAGSYLRRIELGAAGGGRHDLRGALACTAAAPRTPTGSSPSPHPRSRRQACRSCCPSRRPAGSSASQRRPGRPTSPPT